MSPDHLLTYYHLHHRKFVSWERIPFLPLLVVRINLFLIFVNPFNPRTPLWNIDFPGKYDAKLEVFQKGSSIEPENAFIRFRLPA